MQLNLGNKIRELRHRDGRTQEEVANALGVTSQAVSRWESCGSYPDMEIVPSIANYFAVTIDELFGYHSDRDRKINDIIRRIESYNIKSRSDDDWVDECIGILREGLAEFPQNEKLLITLADVLSDAGWRRHKEWLYYDEEGYLQHSYDVHKKNEYWSESAKICENLVNNAKDSTVVNKAISILVLLFRNFGENEKAIVYANRMPGLSVCRELLLCCAADGKEESKYVGDALLKMASQFSDQLVYGLVNNIHNYESDMPIKKIKGAISIYHLLCDDGNFGEYNWHLCELYLYLSRIQWERGYRDDAFDSLYNALKHAKASDALLDGKDHYFTAPLVSFVKCNLSGRTSITKSLPDDWPIWCNPDYRQVESEIKSDKRWEKWAQACKE